MNKCSQMIRVGVGQFIIPTSEDGSRPSAVMQHWYVTEGFKDSSPYKVPSLIFLRQMLTLYPLLFRFDGLGMLHNFNIDGGEINYNSRYTSAGIVRKANANGFVDGPFFGNNANKPLKEAQDPCSAIFGASQSEFQESAAPKPDETIVNVTPRRGMHLPGGDVDGNAEEEEILNHTDQNVLQVCDAKTLEPKRVLTYAEIDPALAGYGICAHPPKDRSRGLTFNYIISDPDSMSVFALDIRSKPTKVMWKTVLPCRPSYIHSLACTEKYVIFIRMVSFEYPPESRLHTYIMLTDIVARSSGH